MKKILSIFVVFALSLTSVITAYWAEEFVRWSVRKNGTYVKPHYRTTKNHTKLDNRSTKGNINPRTGKKWYKKAYSSKSYKTKNYTKRSKRR